LKDFATIYERLNHFHLQWNGSNLVCKIYFSYLVLFFQVVLILSSDFSYHQSNDVLRTVHKVFKHFNTINVLRFIPCLMNPLIFAKCFHSGVIHSLFFYEFIFNYQTSFKHIDKSTQKLVHLFISIINWEEM